MIRRQLALGSLSIIQMGPSAPFNNFSYLFANAEKDAWVIDPLDAGSLKVCHDHDWILRGVINTHAHRDHVIGNELLLLESPHPLTIAAHEHAQVPGQNRALSEGAMFWNFKVMEIPGHTLSDIGLYAEVDGLSALFCGDTLFNGGVGNCYHGGQVALLYQSIERIASLPDETWILTGHDYLSRNLDFTLKFEPNNLFAKKLKQNPKLILTLGEEKQYNLFLRLREKTVWAGLEAQTEWDGQKDPEHVFFTLRQLRDQW